MKWLIVIDNADGTYIHEDSFTSKEAAEIVVRSMFDAELLSNDDKTIFIASNIPSRLDALRSIEALSIVRIVNV